MKNPSKHIKDLFKIFTLIDNEKEAQKVLEDILTPQELESLAERWQIVKMLSTGATQRDIATELNMSISKITRGSRALQYGSGGFNMLLKKIGIGKKGE